MLMKISKYIFGVALLLAFTGKSYAIDLKETPLQQQLSSNISQIAYAGEFDEFNQENQSETSADQGETESGTKKLSTGKAILYSALLPGLGEHYAGSRGKAKYFFAVEAISWIGIGAFTVYGNVREDDMINFAAQNANAQLEGKDDFFLDMVGFYDDIDQYNSLGRVSDPERPYLVDNPENHWVWQSSSDREAYRELKNSSREAFRRRDFIIGVMIVNRVVSIIDAIRDVSRANNKISNDEFSDKNNWKLKFSVNPLSTKNQVKLTVMTPF